MPAARPPGGYETEAALRPRPRRATRLPRSRQADVLGSGCRGKVDLAFNRSRGSSADHRSERRSSMSCSFYERPAGPHPNTDTDSRSLTSALLARCADLEIFHLTASLDCSDQPARLLAPAGPGLGRLWVTIFWKNPGVFSPCPASSAILHGIPVVLPLDGLPAAIENR